LEIGRKEFLKRFPKGRLLNFLLPDFKGKRFLLSKGKGRILLNFHPILPIGLLWRKKLWLKRWVSYQFIH